jgi:hypothetical protein
VLEMDVKPKDEKKVNEKSQSHTSQKHSVDTLTRFFQDENGMLVLSTAFIDVDISRFQNKVYKLCMVELLKLMDWFKLEGTLTPEDQVNLFNKLIKVLVTVVESPTIDKNTARVGMTVDSSIMDKVISLITFIVEKQEHLIKIFVQQKVL